MSIAEKLQTIAENEQKVYGAGEMAERRRQWDAVSQAGKRTNFSSGFWRWDLSGFYPCRDITPTGDAGSMFRSTVGEVDLSERLDSCGVTFDTSQCTITQWMFAYSAVTRVPKIDLSSATNIMGMLYSASKLETIDELALKKDGSQTFSSFLDSCTKLKNLKVTGAIGNDFDVRSSPLTLESALSVCRALRDYSLEETYEHSVIFHADVLTMLNNTYYDNSGNITGVEEGEMTWLQYIDLQGWNY